MKKPIPMRPYRDPEEDRNRVRQLAGRILQPMTPRQRRKYLLSQPTPYRRHLYKYTAAENDAHLRDAIVGNRLFLCGADRLNDPGELQLEVRLPIDVPEALKALERWLHRTSLLKWKDRVVQAREIYKQGNFASIHQAAGDKTRVETGICSLTTDPHNQQMWANYANGHQGICLQYNVALGYDTLCEAVPVIYDDLPVVEIFGRNDLEDPIRRMVLRKHTAYLSEKEWRLVRPTQAGQSALVHHTALSGIILGVRALAELEAKARDFIEERRRSGMSAPKLYRATMRGGRISVRRI
ncbi:DUF2971 domain-containing protein [Solimonas sp. K1W22B-7]|uniref:DUF2971 domain-containing protein n=1 Tax=Solimonas sp. K1W22B-7 TaxID=2303331 RepID=UPI0013C5368F|nr:DUF2971 domain-containing protein [Solimonas sp. K1W22B-7]